MPTKILVTHEGALKKKYGAGWSVIDSAIKRLIVADAARGVTTSFVPLDNPAFGSARAKPGNGVSFKHAIDHAYALHGKPDYIAILGGPDIVPHQVLINPLIGDDADDDPVVPSDLPYACDTPASTKTEEYIGPSRVVGRIPDLPDDKSPSRLAVLLDKAAAWKPAKSASKSYFGLSADKWKKSTTLSLVALFGSSAKPRLSPGAGPAWSSRDMKPVWHFINCHGAPADPQFYGEKKGSFPVAHHSPVLATKISQGTVVTAECCYGAELYDSTLAFDPGICISYLDAGAIGFMGSTTIAYGPADSNGSADLICRFFLDRVRKGASLGRALLEARLQFVKTGTPLSPVDLKTLGQFLLLGDPSLRAVSAAGMKPGAKALEAHALRRRALEADATMLTRGADTSESQSSTVAGDGVRDVLQAAAAAEGYVASDQPRTYRVRRARDAAARGVVEPKTLSAVTFHVMSARPAGEERRPRRPVARALEPPAPGGVEPPVARDVERREAEIPKRMILLGREIAGRLVRVDRLYAHAGAHHGRLLRRTRRQATALPGIQE